MTEASRPEQGGRRRPALVVEHDPSLARDIAALLGRGWVRSVCVAALKDLEAALGSDAFEFAVVGVGASQHRAVRALRAMRRHQPLATIVMSLDRDDSSAGGRARLAWGGPGDPAPDGLHRPHVFSEGVAGVRPRRRPSGGRGRYYRYGLAFRGLWGPILE